MMENYDYIKRMADESDDDFKLRMFGEIGSYCAYCGDMACDGYMVLEHVIPRSRGGSDDSSNLVVACRSCNGMKGSLTHDEWRERIAERNGIDISDVVFALEQKQGHPITGAVRDYIIAGEVFVESPTGSIGL